MFIDFIDKVRHYGVQYINDNMPDDAKILFPKNVIAAYVVTKALAPYRQAIEDSEQYQDFLAGKTRCFVGPGPKDFDNFSIKDYLWGHSIRKGCLGKLVGLVYRVMEFINEFLWGSSDKIKALNEIEELLMQKQKLADKTYKGGIAEALIPRPRQIIPQDIQKEAKLILKGMLTQYNFFGNT